MNNITIRTGTHAEVGEDAHKVRDEVFCGEQGISLELERDELDCSAVHTVVYENQVPVAAGRLIFDNGLCLIGRICSLKRVRGNGYGKLVVDSLIQWGKVNGVSEIHLHSQKHAEGFYKKLGFQIYGEPFFEAEIEHVSMKINLFII